MSRRPPTDEAKFDIAVEPAPKSEVVEADEDGDSKQKRDTALASTFDQTLAHDGKSEEEMIEERKDDTRLFLDTAIALGVVIAIAENAEQDGVDLEAEEPVEPDGEDDGGE